MSFKDQVVNLVIKGRDLFSSVAKKSEQALAGLGTESEILNERLSELGDQKKAVDSIEGLAAAVSKSEKAYTSSSVALDKLVAEQKKAAKELKDLENAQKGINTELNKVEAQYKQSETALSQYSSEIKQAELTIAKLSSEQKKGATASKQQATALKEAKSNLNKLNAEQKQAQQSAQQYALALDKQRRSLTESNTALNQASQTKAKYNLQVKTARTELNKLGTSIGKNKDQLGRYSGLIKKAGFSTEKLGAASKELKQQQAAAEIAINGVNKKLARHNRLLGESKKSAKSFNGSIGSATKSLLALGGAYIGVDTLWRSLTGMLSTGDRAQAFSVQMTALMGSLAEGESATAWVKDFANKTGTRLEGARQAFVRLKTFGLDPMAGSMQSLVDYNALMGGSQQKLEGIILAVGQAWGKQKLQGEEILQLVDRGVPVWELLENVTGKNVVQLQKLSAAGKLGRDTIKQLFDEMGKQANGQASKSLDRLSGQVNVLANNWTDFQEKIADSGALQVAIDFLKELNVKFDELNKNGKIKQAAQDLSDFFSTIIKDGGSSVTQTLENITAFARAIGVISGSLRIVWNGITAGISLVAATATKSWALIIDGYAYMVEAIGGDEIAERARKLSGALHAISEGYVKQIEQDGKDIKASWKLVTGEVEKATTTSANAYKKMGDVAAESTKKIVDGQSDAEKAVSSFENAMVAAGIITVKSLNDQAEAARATYNQVKRAAEDGIATQFELQQAFLKTAQAEIKASEASGKQVDAALKQQAAVLGLTDEYQKLIEANSKVSDSTEYVSSSMKVLVNQIDRTKQAIAKNKAELASSAAASDKNAIAQEKLAANTKKLKEQTELLNKAKALEQANYGQLQANYTSTSNELDRLNEAYRNGSINAEEYNRQKERLIQLLQILQDLMGGLGDEEEDTGDQVDDTTKSLSQQRDELEKLEKQTGRATKYMSLFADANNYLNSSIEAGSKSTEELKDRVDVLTDKLIQNGDVITIWWSDLADMYSEGFLREKKILEEELAIRSYTAELESSGITMGRVSQIAKEASLNLNEMGAENLSVLQNAIDSARTKILALRDDIEGTVDSLKDELDALNENQAAIEARRYENQKTELQQKLKQAEIANDRQTIQSAKEALALSEKIYKVKQQQIKEEQAARQQQKADQQQRLSQANQSKNTQPAAQTRQSKSTTTYVPAQTNSQATQKAELTLIVGNKRFDTQTKQSILQELMAEIRRQQQVGG